MAKGPGPALLLAGVAALFLLKGKKGGGGTLAFPPADGRLSAGGTSQQPSNPPPNLSGYSQGFNADFFASPRNVRTMLEFLGYDVAINDEALIQNPQVQRFQNHYNIASDSGAFKASGKLSTEGTAGPSTLNALEIVVSGGTPNAGMTDPEIGINWEEGIAAIGG